MSWIWAVYGFDIGALSMLAYIAWDFSADWRMRRHWAKHPDELQAFSDSLKALYVGANDDPQAQERS